VDPKQALEYVDRMIARCVATRQEHVLAQQAIDILGVLVNPPPATAAAAMPAAAVSAEGDR